MSVTTLFPPAGLRPAPAAPWRLQLVVRRLTHGRQGEARWVRPALLGLLGITALLYLWNLGASGWANGFYSAAVQAGSTSWKAFFFGSFDSSSFITVDKPPLSLWVMDLSARVFGVNAWSLLVPQAVEGVAAVALLYATVRRWFAPEAGLLAGAALALTPVAALMFRFNNPDALLTLLLVAATYATVRAVERGSTRWLAFATTIVGFGFLTKMLQAFLIVPAIALVFLLAAPTSWRRRAWSLGVAAVAMVAASSWWVAIVQLIPAADRPYIGGSQNNSILNLIFGYNGFGRITGSETGSVGGNGLAGSMWGPTGWNRLFLPDFGGQVAWLIPAALILLGAALWITRRAPRTDRTRAALLLSGATFLITAVVISYAQGIIHPYYTVVLAPPLAATVAMGATMMWARREQLFPRVTLAAALLATAVLSFVLLGRSTDFVPPLRTTVLLAGAGAAAAMLALPWLRGRAPMAVVVIALFAALAGPAAYTIDTVVTPHNGAIPSAGPAVASARFGGPGGPGTASPGVAGGFGQGGPSGLFGPPPGGFAGAGGGFPGGASSPAPGASGSAAPGATGGLLDTSSPGAQLTAALRSGAGHYRWVAAVVGANSAAGYQLATGDAVMAIGGFNGTDPTPTLAQFEQLVAQHQIHYFISDGRGFGAGPGAGSSSTSSAIGKWVQSYFTATTVDGVTVYDLSVAR